jgi:hypothetical protein
MALCYFFFSYIYFQDRCPFHLKGTPQSHRHCGSDFKTITELWHRQRLENPVLNCPKASQVEAISGNMMSLLETCNHNMPLIKDQFYVTCNKFTAFLRYVL